MISLAVHQLIEEVAAIGSGERATAPIPDDLTDTLATMAGRVAGSLPDERLACPWLLAALTAAYHLGRKHAMERVAVGLSIDTDGIMVDEREFAAALDYAAELGSMGIRPNGDPI